jgi:hypothetical protein
LIRSIVVVVVVDDDNDDDDYDDDADDCFVYRVKKLSLAAKLYK